MLSIRPSSIEPMHQPLKPLINRSNIFLTYVPLRVPASCTSVDEAAEPSGGEAGGSGWRRPTAAAGFDSRGMLGRSWKKAAAGGHSSASSNRLRMTAIARPCMWCSRGVVPSVLDEMRWMDGCMCAHSDVFSTDLSVVALLDLSGESCRDRLPSMHAYEAGGWMFQHATALTTAASLYCTDRAAVVPSALRLLLRAFLSRRLLLWSDRSGEGRTRLDSP